MSEIKAFTLIELLAVIAVVAVMSGILILNYDPSSEKLALNNLTAQAEQSFLKAEDLALSGIGASTGSHYGVGVYFGDTNGKEYIVYRNSGSSYDGFEEGVDTIIEKIVLDEKLKYLVNSAQNDVLFVPPDPYILICNSGVCSENSLLDISFLRSEDEGITDTYRNITINNFGVIEHE